MSTAQEELVLVVPTAVFHELGHFNGFCDTPNRYLPTLLEPRHVTFQPRSVMEQDPSYKQLIPYVIFRHEADEGTELFHYTRGSGQGEDRLHSKMSIGVGGHISTLDANQAEVASIYQVGLQRELAEEVDLQSVYRESCVGLINDDTTEVGRVHLGVVHLFDLQQPRVEPREREIEAAGFAQLGTLWQDFERFESWSQICLRALFETPEMGASTHPTSG